MMWIILSQAAKANSLYSVLPLCPFDGSQPGQGGEPALTLQKIAIS